MGLLSKIKDILFEDDGEEPSTENMPVFTKEDSNLSNSNKVHETVSFNDEEDDTLKVTTGSRFKNDKRDFELDDGDIIGEEKTEETPKEEEIPISKLEDSSPILPFDEDEFDRVNERVNQRVERVQEKSAREIYQEKDNLLKNVDARKANSNFSSTDAPRERYENISSTSVTRGEKKFTPSPVISPVYGILDKNYKKEEIVDRVGGLKREKKVKLKEEEEKVVEPIKEEVKEADIPILKEEIVHEEPITVDLDSVRKKAFGSIDNLLEEALEEVKKSPENKVKEEDVPEPVVVKEEEKIEIPKVEEVQPEVVEEEIHPEEVAEIPVLDRVQEVKDVTPAEEEPAPQESKMIEDLLEEEVEEPAVEEDVSDLILQDIDENKKDEKREDKELDDLEKTSTLKILDDIEKELNDIEPVAKKDNLENTLENDLFNLIDSMYEKGEE